jgi:DNA processing protein
MDTLSKKILYALSILDIKPARLINIFKLNEHDINRTLRKITCKKINEDSRFSVGRSGNSWSFKKLIEYVDSNNINVINISESGYPALLKEIAYPPPLLFVRGKRIIPDRPGIAVVGTRRFTHYGRDAAIYISEQLSELGVTVVSGMATGIDYFAHRAALQKKGRSIGVLGCGIDVIYPYENKDLYKEIIKNGSIVTEYLPGMPPLKQNFPARNRIISGLSMGVVVVEAAEKSGALITSEFALEQNREVFSIPGSIFSYESRGCNNLIKKGAKLVGDIDDILEELKQYTDIYESEKIEKIDNDDKKNKKRNSSSAGTYKKSDELSEEQKKVYDFIGYRPKGFEEIIMHTGLSTAKILQIISELQFDNLIIEKNLNEFVRIC